MSIDRKRKRFSFGIRHLFIFVAACAFVFGASNWLIRWPSISLSGVDLKSRQAITIVAWGDNPTALEIRITGNIDGRAEFTDPWGKKTAVGPGRFEISEYGDYYDSEASITYSPKKVIAGRITVRYNFDYY